MDQRTGRVDREDESAYVETSRFGGLAVTVCDSLLPASHTRPDTVRIAKVPTAAGNFQVSPTALRDAVNPCGRLE